MIELIPDLVFHGITAIGVCGIIASIVLRIISLASTWRFAIEALSILFLAVGVYFEGRMSSDVEWQIKAIALENKVLEAQTESRVENIKIVEKIVEKEKAIYDKSRSNVVYIENEVTKHNSECTLPIEFINAHNISASAP